MCTMIMTSSLLRHHTQPFRTLSTLLSSSYQSVVPELLLNPGRTRRRRIIHKIHKTCSFIDINKTSSQVTCRFYSPDANAASDNTHDDICQLLHEIGSRVELANNDSRARSARARSSERKSASLITSEFCKVYLSLPDKQLQLLSDNNNKCKIIELLISERYDINKDNIISTIDIFRSKSILRCNDIQKIRDVCTPQYESIFQYIIDQAQNDLGVAFLVKLRRDVRDLIHYMKFADKKVDEEIQQQSKLKRLQTLEKSIHALLTSLFRPGVLRLKRITFEETPAAIIEQIALREAVHPLQSLQELKARLGPGRRCFAFFHPALPSKPLVFVHVALLKEMPSSMNDIQYSDNDDSERNATCATFYSITNTEPGLAGVDLGNHLIKSVVLVLQNEFHALDTFSTLSPLPKFKSWLEDKLTRYHEQIHNRQHSTESERPSVFIDEDLFTEKEMQKLEEIFPTKTPLLDMIQTLKSPTWHKHNPHLVELKPILMKLAAYYMTKETYRGRPLCPVAKFHIRNGAEMYRLNYMADTSSKGLRNSCGIMINYHYALDEIEENRVQYEVNGDVVVKDGVKCWLNE